MNIPTLAEDHEVLLKAIIRRFSTLDDQKEMQELVILALGMLLRRADDKPLRDLLISRAHVVLAGYDPSRRRQTAQSCVELLQTAQAQRQPRDAVMLPTSRKMAASAMVPVVKAQGCWTPFPVMASGAVLALSLICGIFTLTSATALPEMAAAPASASVMAAQIVEMAGMSAGTPAQSRGGADLYLLRKDNRPLVVTENMPRRLCAASGWLLARDGDLTVNGVAPERNSKAAVASLCYQRDGNAKLTWSPTAARQRA